MKHNAMISVIGHFGDGRTLLDGQTIKTKIVTDELERRFGKDEVLRYDTYGRVSTLLKAPFQVISALKWSKNIVILPAHNGIRIYAPLLSCFRRLFKGRKLHYVVIGGWLPAFLLHRKGLAATLGCFDGIYVETVTMKKTLEAQNLKNISVMPNCKKLTILAESELVYPQGMPYKLCTFSRVLKEKGIGTAVNAVKNVNDRLGYTAYTLDIYGPIDQGQTDWFDKLQKNAPAYVHYCGCVDADKSVDVLQNYYTLLFPTEFYTEGIPGTIIDAYAAGIPVIASKWESCLDIIDEGKTGITYEFGNREQLEHILLDAAHNPQMLLNMKGNCIRKAKDYAPERAITTITKKLQEG